MQAAHAAGTTVFAIPNLPEVAHRSFPSLADPKLWDALWLTTALATGQVEGEADDAPGAQRAPRSLSGLQAVPEQRQPASSDTLAGRVDAIGLTRLDGMAT